MIPEKRLCRDGKRSLVEGDGDAKGQNKRRRESVPKEIPKDDGEIKIRRSLHQRKLGQAAIKDENKKEIEEKVSEEDNEQTSGIAGDCEKDEPVEPASEGMENTEEIDEQEKIMRDEKEEKETNLDEKLIDEEKERLEQKELKEFEKRMEKMGETIYGVKQELAEVKRINKELESKVEGLEKSLDKERKSNKREIELLKKEMEKLKENNSTNKETNMKKGKNTEAENDSSEEEPEREINSRYFRKMPEPLSKHEYEWEMKERAARKKNVFIRGIRTTGRGIEEELRRIVKEKIGVNLYIEPRTLRAIGGGIVVTLESMRNKIFLMKNKNRLEENKMWIEDDYTKREREVQKWLSEVAEEEKRNGQTTKVGYLKLSVNGAWYQWDEMSGTLTDQTFEEEN